MENANRLNQLPIASLTEEQLNQLKRAEEAINQTGDDVYLIAFQKEQ
ncbi:hypothetical protein ACTID9_20280 [Brevibacillus fluminis]